MKTSYKKLLLLLLMLPLNLLAQSKLQGVVTDNTSGQPLPGVNVTVKGTNNGVSTNFDGQFTLSNLKNGDTILFSFLGFKEQAVTFNGQNNITVTLQEESAKLDEVVVVGYGSVKKKDATGSVTQIGEKDFNKGSIVTTENLLNGRVAGLTVNTSGAPGSGSEIRIRGGSSLFANNDPLIVVDGLPIDNATATGSTSYLASLNPATIESLTVLKDASATAIYGSRASNGVIIITTKKGTKKLSVAFDSQLGYGEVANTVDVMSSSQFVNAIETYFPSLTNRLGVDDPNSTATDDLSTPGIIEGRILYNTDWQKEIYRKTEYVSNNLNLSGNLFNLIPTRLTLGNTYQQGLRKTNEFTRTTASLGLTPAFFDNHLKLTANVNYSNERNRFTNGVEGSALRFDPTKPVYDGSNTVWGGFFEYLQSPDELTASVARNPVSELLLRRDKGVLDRVFGNVQADYKLHFFPDLRAVINVGLDHTEGIRRISVPKYAATSAGNGGNNIDDRFGNLEYNSSLFNNKLFDGYLVYNKKVNKLNIEATAGYSYQKFERQFYTSENQLSTTPTNPDLNIETDLVLLGFFGRTNLSWNDKYLLTLAYRRDGSSRFPKDNQYGNFPAASFAWKINKDFFEDSKILSDLKLRLGWGITGQQDLGPAKDFYLPIYTTGGPNNQYYFGDQVLIVGQPAALNPYLKWEETTTYNAGFDFGFFNNRLSGTIDAFYKVSDDLLANVAFADGANFSNFGYQNIGSFTTKGIEFNINADIIKKEKLNWNINFNASTFERKIDKLAYNSDINVGDIGGGTGGKIQVFRENYTPFSFLVYKQLYNEDGSPIEGAYADLNGDNIINNSDRYIYKNPDPDLLMGFQSTLNYKNIDFSFNLRASIGNHVYNNVNSSRAQLNLLQDNAVLGNIPTSALTSQFRNTSDVILSDYYIENASFLRMDNVTLGYTFPKWIEGKASLRLNAGIQNPFVITKYSGLDPEITGGIDNTIYPRQRQFLFGANIKF